VPCRIVEDHLDDEDGLNNGHVSESSEAPEWANVDIASSVEHNIDDDFHALATRSAEVFEAEFEFSDMTSCKRSSRDSSRNRSTSEERFAKANRTPKFKKKDRNKIMAPIGRPQKKASRNESEDLTSKYIAELTREYRQRLEEAVANGLPLSELKHKIPPVSLTLPNDLTESTWTNQPSSSTATDHMLGGSQWPPDVNNMFPSLLQPLTPLSSNTRASESLFAQLSQPSNMEQPFGTLPSDESGGIWKPLFEDFMAWKHKED
jgi:hypothetical protein